MDVLNSLVWPSIATLSKQQIIAVLLEAQWDSFVHEVWVCIVPRDEAVKRLIDRNNLSEEQARQRIDLQMTNIDRVQRANVVLIMESSRQGKGVVVLDAAVLLEAQWDRLVHEVWVCIVPRDEEQATQRIDLQMTNTNRVQRANVVLFTLWE
ncbi:bifunctional coenzyme A synthase-like [Lingula anatina]|uniref:Bifunctional coenzyme A synthase-like n=1 Tax=Lingula anatina TaxID=7574 RepID=A0A1S3IEB5_LINAN|nr:bifunctional coenzyme A synthase-like [Lingula anatina]|eukprot:XP_013395799.1 bifunctional coenzyme A synthase-like [Lingula anatina]